MSDAIERFKVTPRPDGKAYLQLDCQRTPAGYCQFPLWRQEATGTMWRWDGDLVAPTISPSIDCKGGCGRHFTMVKGLAT